MMNKIPKGFLINCPHCRTSLYKVGMDVGMGNTVKETLNAFVAIFPQPLIDAHSEQIQTCFKCKQEFNFIGLVRETFIGGIK